MYKLYQSKVITENYYDFLEHCKLAKRIITDKVGPETTWTYEQYNAFNMTCTSALFFDLFKELNGFIRDYVGDDRRIWMQSWINYHTPKKVLDWHAHGWKFHGYISVDPKNTKTIFRGYEIENKIGQVYIGPGQVEHKVVVNEPYEGDRITIGFDCAVTPDEIFTHGIPII